MQKKIALIGSGNAFFKDEGVGLYAAKYIKENYFFEPNIVEIVDGGTLGFKLMPLLQEFEEVIIVNTASDESKKVGEITLKNRDEFLEGALIKKTANEVEIAEMLQICSLSERMANVQVISIVPKDIISVSVSLSKELQSAWEAYIQTIIKTIENLDVKVQQKKESFSLEETLYIFENPSIENQRGF